MLNPLRLVSKSGIYRGKMTFSSTPTTVVYSWGLGTNGELGHPKFELTQGILEKAYFQQEPRKMIKSKRFKNVAVGDTFSLGLTHTGDLFGWGKDFVNPGGKIQSNEPVPIVTEHKIKFISAGKNHSAIIDEKGQVYTWGSGGDWMRGGGQLGHGDTKKVDTPKLVKQINDYGAKAIAVSCAGLHTLILTDDGEVLSCGVGEYGRLGTGNSDDTHIPVSVDTLDDVGDITQIAAGFDHSLVLTSTGTIYGWGRNNLGQLGQMDSNLDIYSMEDYPKLIDSESIAGVHDDEHSGHVVFKQIAAGNGRSAAISNEGLLYVWGGRISNTPKLIEKSLFNNQKIKKVAIGGEANRSVIACITEKNELWTFGDAGSKMLGIPGLSGKHPLPMKVMTLDTKQVVDISCGFGQHMFAFVVSNE